jgi:transposase
LTRTRKQLVREISQYCLRIQKTPRRGAKKAILAVAASMLTAAYHMLKNGVEYHDLSADHFTRRDRSKAIQRLVRRINDLGCTVQLTPLAA